MLQTVSGITVRSAYNCVYLSKHIESCLKMVLSLHINVTAKRNVELNRRQQLLPGTPASSGCSLFYTPYLTRSLHEHASRVLWAGTFCKHRRRQPKKLYKVALSVGNLQSQMVLFYKTSFPWKFTFENLPLTFSTYCCLRRSRLLEQTIID